MAKIRNWMKRPDLVRQLHELEVPVDVTKEDLSPDGALPKLQIELVGGVAETTAFDLSSGAAAYMLSVSLTVLRTPFAIAAFEIEVPWPNKYMTWLSDPADRNGPRNSYQFPGRNAPEFPREMVINHRANAQRNLPAGTCIEGLLVGFGFDSIPESYMHGSMVVAKLGIVDQFGAEHKADISLWIDRLASPHSKPRNVPPRISLFAGRAGNRES